MNGNYILLSLAQFILLFIKTLTDDFKYLRFLYLSMLTKEQVKNTGATFTPKDLADFLSIKLLPYITNNNLRILDPACGEGELLLSIGKQLQQKEVNFTLTGYDAHSDYLKLSRERLNSKNFGNNELIQADFLKTIDIAKKQTSLDFSNKKRSLVNNSFDIVIANPPYVRTQLLGKDQAQDLAKKFDLKGRVDLYYPFLIAMTESLKEGGILGVITSNRYLFTKSGESIRKYLSENYEILELIDLGDTKLFEAAVLPAIFIGRKTKLKNPSKAKFTKLYENFNVVSNDSIAVNTVYDILADVNSGYFVIELKKYKKSSGILKYSIGSSDAWEMLSSVESQWISRIDASAKNKVGDFFKVRVGIKSTADKVFISDQWGDMGVEKPEDELLKDLLSQENIEPWNATDNFNLKVLYPHYSEGGVKQTIDLESYPKAKKYFLTHEETLKARKYLIEAGRKWYELWVPHKPDLWIKPKLVFPDISLNPRFYFDEKGKIVNGNCYWIVANTPDEIQKLLLIQGVANSKLMTKYHDLVFNNKLYSGRRRYLTQYVEKYPLPDFNSPIAKEIIDIAKRLNQNSQNANITDLEKQLEIKVADAFKVQPIFTLD